MSYPAKKTFHNPAWVLFAGLFILAGCQIDVTSDTGTASGEIALEDEGATDDTQETASEPGDGSTVDTVATLMWDAPQMRENGDTLKVGEIDHYVVSWGQDPDTLENSEQIPCENCTDMEHVIEDLGEGTWYFTVQTRDTEGKISRQADIASKNI